MSDYIPIDCGLYSGYELAIMHRQRLRVGWRDRDGVCHLETLLPLDLQTREHAEYLLARTSAGQNLKVRLDWIVRMNPLRK